MAVFTDITDTKYRSQLRAVENAYEISITSIEGIPLGSSDSLFKISTSQRDEALVLTSASASVTDRMGELVKLIILKPLRAHANAPNQAPHLELTFEGIQKCASILPFVRGKCYVNSPEELVDPHEALLVGKALGAYLMIAKSFPNPEIFSKYLFHDCAQDVAQVSGDPSTEERLGYVLSKGRSEGSAAVSIGRQYMADMMERGQRLVREWDRVSSNESVYANTLIHGDVFTDNVIFDEEGNVVLLDFNEISFGPIGLDIGTALSSWASRNGKPVIGNALKFLEGFDSVEPLTGEQLAQIPTFVQIGAYRWETFRVQRIGMQDPRRITMRSPDEFRSIQLGWRKLESVFAGLSSLQDLETRIS